MALRNAILIITIIFISSLFSKPTKEKKQYDPGRSYEIVQKALKEKFQVISETFQKIDSIYNQKKMINLKFYISPTGKMSFMGFSDSIVLDKKSEMEIKQSLHFRVLDTVQKMETITKVVVSSNLEKNKVVLSDKIDIDYIEIRSKSSILIVIDMNRRDLRKAYSRRWKDNKKLQGTITVKFGINENGDVVNCNMENSTLNDKIFENTIINSVKNWKFGQIYNPGDITEIVYPFTFNQ